MTPRHLSADLFDIHQSELAQWEKDVFDPAMPLGPVDVDRLTYICTYALRRVRLGARTDDVSDGVRAHMAQTFGLSPTFCDRLLNAAEAILEGNNEVAFDKIRRPNLSAAVYNFLVGGLMIGFAIFLIWTMSLDSENNLFNSVMTGGMYVLAGLTALIFPIGVYLHLSDSFVPRSGKIILRETDNFVLYLRSHADEGQKLGKLSTLFGGGADTVERAVEESMKDLNGAAVAILNPRDKNVPVADLYWIAMGDEYVWQDAVLILMAVAKAIVINTGESEWVKWETTVARNKTTPGKIILLSRETRERLTEASQPVSRITEDGSLVEARETPNFDFQLGMNRPRSREARIASMIHHSIIMATHETAVTFDAQVGSNMGRNEALFEMKSTLLVRALLDGAVDEAESPSGPKLRGKPQMTGDTPADKLVNEGNTHLASGNLEQARASFQTALDTDEESARAQISMGNTLMMMDDVQAALPYLETGAGLIPGDARAHNALGQAYVRLDRLGDAQKAFLTAISCDLDHGPATFALGHTLLRQEEYETALPYLERAKELGEDADAEITLAKLAPR